MSADGSIIVDTGMNNAKFKAGAREFKNALSSLKSATTKVGQEMSKSGAGYTKAMSQQAKSAREVRGEIKQLESEAAKLKRILENTGNTLIETDAYKKLTSEIERAQKAVGKLKATQSDMKAVGADQPSKRWRDLQQEIKWAKESIDEFYASSQKQDAILKANLKNAIKSQNAREIEEARAAIDAYNKEYYKTKQIVSKTETDLQRLLEEQKKLSESGEDKPSKAYIMLEEKIRRAQSELQRLIDKRNELAYDDKGFISGKDTEKYAEMSRQYSDMQDKIESLRAVAPTAFSGLKTTLGEVASGFAKVGSIALQAAGKIARLAGHGALAFLKKLAAGAKNAAVALARLASSAVKASVSGIGKLARGAGKAAKGFLGLFRNSNKAHSGLKIGLKGVLGYALGVQSLFALIRKLGNVAKEGFGELAKQSPAVKSALNGLQGALNGLKGALTTAFAPILTAVAPALITLINLLTTAMNTIGAFFAALGGGDYFMKSTAAIKATGGAAKKTGGAVDKLKRELAGFDELNILQDKNSGGSGGGGGGGSGSGYKYEKTEIGENIKSFADELREKWLSQDFTGIGTIIAIKINAMLSTIAEKISWANVSARVTSFVNAVKDIMGGLLTGINWEGIGNAASEALHTLSETLQVAMDVKLFFAAGGALARVINGFFANEETWRSLGETLNTGIKGVVNFAQGFIDSINETNVALAVRDALERLEWGSIASQVWDVITQAFAKAGNFVNVLLGGKSHAVNTGGEEFERVGDELDEFRKQKVVKTKWTVDESVWDDLADNITTNLNNFVTDTAEFIRTLPTKGVIEAFTSWFNRVWLGVKWTGVGDLFGSLIGGVLTSFGTIIANFAKNARQYGEDIGNAIKTAINRAFTMLDEDNKTIGSIFTDAISGAINFIDALVDIFDPVKAADKIREQLGDIPWGTLLSEMWETVKKAASKLGSFFTVLLGGELDLKKDSALDVDEARKEQMAMRKGEVYEPEYKPATFSQLAVALLNTITDVISQIPWGDIGTGLRTELGKIKWSEVFDAAWEAFKAAFAGLGEFVGGLLGIGGKSENSDANSGSNSLAPTIAGVAGIALGGSLLKDVGKLSMISLLLGGGGSGGLLGAVSGLAGTLLKVSIWGKLFIAALAAATYGAYKFTEWIDTSDSPLAETTRNTFGSITEYLGSIIKPKDVADTLEQQVRDGLTPDFGKYSVFALEEYIKRAEQSNNPELLQALLENLPDRLERNREDIADKLSEIEERLAEENPDYAAEQQAKAAQAAEDAWERFASEGTAEGAMSDEQASQLFNQLGEDIKTTQENTEAINQASNEGGLLWKSLGRALGLNDKEPIDVDATIIGFDPNVQPILDVEPVTQPSSDFITSWGSEKPFDDFLFWSEIDTKEQKKNTKALKKDTKKRKELDLNLEGTGLEILNADNPSLNIDVKFKTGGESDEEVDENGLIGWLKKILGANSFIIDVLALLTGKDPKSLTPKDLWDSFIKILAWLTGKDPKSLKLSDIWDSFIKILALLTGKDPKSIKLKDIWDSFIKVLAWLTGKDPKSIKLKDIWDSFIKIVARLTGKDPKSIKLKDIWDSFIKIVALLTGKDPKSLSLGKIFGTIVSFIANLISKGSNWKEKGGIAGWFHGFASIIGFIANLLTGGSNWKKEGGIGKWFNAIAPAVSFIANLLTKGSNWKEKGGIGKWFNFIAPAVSFIANLLTKGSNWLSKGGVSKWLAYLGYPAATFIANLTKKNSNWVSDGLSAFFGGAVTIIANLTNKNSNWVNGLVQWITGNSKGSVSVAVNFVKGTVGKIVKYLASLAGIDLASGGVIANGMFRRFASGGIISGGMAKYLGNVPHYAAGTARAHGTVFVAGEAGPEVMGHINGRTEILNKSQIAQAIYSAVVAGMSTAVNALGTYVANHMTRCTDAIVNTIAANNTFAGISNYHSPIMASGSIMPYEVMTQFKQGNAELQNKLDANNDELIRAMVNAIGNAAVSIVSAINSQGNGRGGMSNADVRRIINDLNARTQMFGSSPLMG